MDHKDLRSFTYDELTSFVIGLGEMPYRGRQIFEWLHVHMVNDVTDMKNIPKTLKDRLRASATIAKLTPEVVSTSKEDGTKKYLFRLDDGNMVESVLMRHDYGITACISSQVGCRMGCTFCASGIGGRIRNLLAGEMLGQIYAMRRELMAKEGEDARIDHVVVMGTGEPLDNFENLVDFLNIITNERGQNLSIRNITVSTCGIVPKIYELADLKLGLTLALSLHASSQKKREKLMPIAKTYDLSEVLKACDYYFDQTGRRMSYEYGLIAGENDGDEDVRGLTGLLAGKNAHLNLIPINPISERDFEPPDKAAAGEFRHKLEKNGINVTIRRSMGGDIDGACGQLRRRYDVSLKEG